MQQTMVSAAVRQIFVQPDHRGIADFHRLTSPLSNYLLSGNGLAKGANAAIDVRWNEAAETIVDSMEGNLYSSVSPNLYRVASMSAGRMGNLDYSLSYMLGRVAAEGEIV